MLRVAWAGALVAAGVPGRDVLGQGPATISEGDWLMDYRNADGSVAEMCGNGVLVFAHYLRAGWLESRDDFVVGSRAGARTVLVHSAGLVEGEVSVDMGPVRELGPSRARIDGVEWQGTAIDVGNPHPACIASEAEAGLGQLDLLRQPEVDADLFSDGVNIEILTALRDEGVDMRVHERGVGETRSCGTGTVAAAYAALLRGPSVLLAHGQIDEYWWRG